MGHKQTSGYHKTRVLNKIRLFDRFQSKESELDRFEKLRSCAALENILILSNLLEHSWDSPTCHAHCKHTQDNAILLF